jgi:hypothetical protein
MGTTERYCKAYPVQRLREFSGWKEKTQNLRKVKKQVDGKEVETVRELTDEDYLFLHENYTVTDGIFSDENVIFDAVTSDWKEFCRSTLKFEIPVYESVQVKAEAN